MYICRHCGNLRPEFNSDGVLNMPHITVYCETTGTPADMANFICFDTPECKALADAWLTEITSMITNDETPTVTITGTDAFRLGPA